jgi:hypothetical protein
MNRTDFLKKLGLGSIALATGSKLTINDISEDEFYQEICKYIDKVFDATSDFEICYEAISPDKLETIDHTFKTPSGFVISPKQMIYNTESVLNMEIMCFENTGYSIYYKKGFESIKEEFLWIQKNYSFDEYHQLRIDTGLRKIEDITKTFPKR